jgi:branched-chain amino acid aminotransferase
MMKENQTPIVLVNDRFVPEEQAVVSVLDRGFLYGDGLFETVRVSNGRLFRWGRHMLRLHRGARFLRLDVPATDGRLRELAMELIRLNGASEGILRLTLTRGSSARGYSPKNASKPTLVMMMHPMVASETNDTPCWRLVTSSSRLRTDDPLALFKSCNRLVQVLARAEADDAGCDEVLFLNDAGFAVETASGNLFWIDKGEVCTAPLSTGILPGVTRSVLFEVCDAMGKRVIEQGITRGQLLGMEGAFASVSSLGVVEIAQIDQAELRRSDLVSLIRGGYEEVLQRETGG